MPPAVQTGDSTLVEQAREEHSNCRRTIDLLLRHHFGVTQKELAEITGIQAYTLTERLAGRSDLRAYELEAIARAFDVPVAVLRLRPDRALSWVIENPPQEPLIKCLHIALPVVGAAA